jgi:hypothetical protein
MPIAPSSVLYYPTIDVPDGAWLRSAVLFWDTVRTIVPEGYHQPYRSRFALDLQDEGVLRPISVNPDIPEVRSLSEDVLDYITDPAAAEVIFAGADSGSRVHADKLPRIIHEFMDLHSRKMPRSLSELTGMFPEEPGFVSVERGFAAFYMTLLAKALSEARGIGLVTGFGEADGLATALRRGKILRSSDVASQGRLSRHYELTGRHRNIPRGVATGLMVDLMFEGVKVPAAATARQLIGFRNDHLEELALLRNELASLLQEVPEGIPLEGIREAVHNQYHNRVQPALSRVRSALTRRGWETASAGFLKTSFMAVPATSALALLQVSTPTALLVGAGLSLTATAIKVVNERRDALDSCPYSYLLSLQRHRW